MFSLSNLSKCLLHLNYKTALSMNIKNIDFQLLRLTSSFSSQYTSDRDPAPFFFNSDIQQLLKNLTRIDINKIFVKRRLENTSMSQPVYKFMTDQQLQESQVAAKKRAEELLQIPPVVLVRKLKEKILARDPALQGLLTHKMVFTDITYGGKETDCLIVVRDVDGTLKSADLDIRERMNRIYFPRPGRKLKVPRMFYGEYLEDILKRFEYKFLLDRACVQFEPDSIEYHRITDITYQHINDHNKFDKLRSTRHFGSLVFYLIWFKKVDNLLLELIETGYIEEVNSLLKLYSMIHQIQFNLDNDLEAIHQYISKCAQKKSSLELAVQSYYDVGHQKSSIKS